jgi:hypothetical protein
MNNANNEVEQAVLIEKDSGGVLRTDTGIKVHDFTLSNTSELWTGKSFDLGHEINGVQQADMKGVGFGLSTGDYLVMEFIGDDGSDIVLWAMTHVSYVPAMGVEFFATLACIGIVDLPKVSANEG